MAAPVSTRGQWGSRFAFILAAAGSAIGLGNIWRFPYVAGSSGGGAFVLAYLFFVVLIGVPVLLAELSIGRTTQQSPVSAFKALMPASLWPYVGLLGVLAGFAILAFYSVIAGWTLGYLYHAVVGTFAGGITGEESEALFGSLIGSAGLAITLTAVFLLLTVLVVRGGIGGGIERTTSILMPLLFVLLLVLAVRAVTLDGAAEGLRFLFAPDFSKLTGPVLLGGLGQALFSMSLGMGAMITYGSYFPKDENLPISGATVAFFDTFIAILAGVIIFPALFSTGVEPNAGAGLVFVVLPTIFDALPAGAFFAIAFYTLLAIAALTSTISLLEVVVSYFVDERAWSRERAAWFVGGVCFLLAIPSALSQGASPLLSDLGGLSFIDWQNIIFGNYALSIGALLISIFAGWAWGVPQMLDALREGGHDVPAARLLGFLIKYVCPIAILLVLLFIILTQQYF